MLTCFFDQTEEGARPPPTTTPRVQARAAADLHRLSPPSSRRGTPQDILSIFFCCSWPSGFFFFLSGWVGSPCRVFLFPRCLGGVFLLLGGWVPLLRFPGVFPALLGWVGGRFGFCVFLLSLASCIFLF